MAYASTHRQPLATQALVFKPPPGWPTPPSGWTPTPGWRPPDEWPPAPPGWRFWRISRYQVQWLRAFWLVVVLNLGFVLLAATGSDVPPESLLATLLGLIAVTLGAAMATGVARRGVSDVDFDDAAKAMRPAALAWLILAGTLLTAAIVGTNRGERDRASDEVTQFALAVGDSVSGQIVGFLVLFLVVGDGYSSYRRLTKGQSSPSPLRSEP